jgi:hypothetical protein
MITDWPEQTFNCNKVPDGTIVHAYGKFWRKVTPRSTRQERRNLLKRLNIDPDMAKTIKIEYKELPAQPDPEHFRIPIYRVITATAKAIYTDFGDKKEWLPVSVVKYGKTGKQRAVDMPKWLADKYKLLSYGRER